MKRITRFHNFENILVDVCHLGTHYACYLEDKTYLGWIPESIEADEAFRNENWQFFCDAFDLINKVEDI